MDCYLCTRKRQDQRNGKYGKITGNGISPDGQQGCKGVAEEDQGTGGTAPGGRGQGRSVRQDDRDSGSAILHPDKKKTWRQAVEDLHAEDHRRYQVRSLCGLFGVGKQAYYQYDEDAALAKAAREEFALQYIREIRKTDPGIRRTGVNLLVWGKI